MTIFGLNVGRWASEDWSNDAENPALITRINYILKYIQIVRIFHNITDFTAFFCQINAA